MNDDNELTPATESTDAPQFRAVLVSKKAVPDHSGQYEVTPPAVIGRFDPTVGPIAVDLGDHPDGKHVSRNHAKITLEDDAYFLHDLDSSNGTWVVIEGEFVKVESTPLKDGDTIAFGNAQFTFEIHAASAPEPEVDVTPNEPDEPAEDPN